MTSNKKAQLDLLGGAERKRTRPRGFINFWRPIGRTKPLLAQVEEVLEEYADHLPLTIRQIFYRLVGAHGYDKTDLAYFRLCDLLNRGRRARSIPMDAIRDDGGTVLAPTTYRDAEDFLEIVRSAAKHIKLDRTLGHV
jgi:hypothetical protein